MGWVKRDPLHGSTTSFVTLSVRVIIPLGNPTVAWVAVGSEVSWIEPSAWCYAHRYHVVHVLTLSPAAHAPWVLCQVALA